VDTFAVDASKEITILNRAKLSIGEIKVMPNPYVVINGTGSIRFGWNTGAKGTIELKIYNMNAELIRVINAPLEAGHADWNLKTLGGNETGDGLYICMLTAKQDTGAVETKTVKFALISKNNSY
jgi:hypothetical protein